VRLAVAIVTGILLAATLDARADTDRRPTAWSKGVPDVAQRRALQLFQDGNVFFEQAKYTEAIAKYEQALAVWDHPNIRFNMAICLINMRQPLVAWQHLEQALRFGAAPLGKRLHAEAMTYRAALGASLAELKITATQPEVTVMLDGGQVLVGAGERTLKLLAGKHQLVASRRGYVTDSRALDLPAGQPVVERIALVPERVKVERENYDRRWPWWTPWIVAGSAVAIGGVGAGLYASARTDIKRYDQDLATLCPLGCAPGDIPASLSSRERSARRKSGVAVGMLISAGALAIGSGVMAILNRPRKVEDRRADPELTVAPGYVGVGLTIAFH
jgi:tetratricopeptide (TPR) repeat protein